MTGKTAAVHIFTFCFVSATLLAACSADVEPIPPPPEPVVTGPPTHAEYIANLRVAGLTDTLLVDGWLTGAHTALRKPTGVAIPHEEAGIFVPHDVRSVGLAFNVIEGQTLRIAIDRSSDSRGRLFAQLFFNNPQDFETPFRQVATLTDTAGGEFTLTDSGRYILRLQPELHASIDYRVRLELEAALPFPVSGHTRRSVLSFFGDVRDGGRRRHEGIDIFAKRDTPVVAVVDGTAVARESRRGGNVVWLRGGGRSYYFAHLNRIAISRRQRVNAGDVIGYVGNTGNARTTPPHLHFGIYRRGWGAIDPFPYFEAFTFSEEPPESVFEPGFGVITTTGLNLRETPGTDQPPVTQLEAGTIVEKRAAAGDWLRVQLANGTAGWIHRRYQREAAATVEPLRLVGDSWLHASPGGQPVERIRAGRPIYRFGSASDWDLIGIDPQEPMGWMPNRSPERASAGP
ncbi:MAG: M23 family metallopeptidase [Pseudomonadota bacterium]